MDQPRIPMHKSKVLLNLDQFRISPTARTGLMRSQLDMFLLWQVIQHFQPQSFLEIGFAAGQTMGIIYEASQTTASYVSVDKDYSYRSIFQSVFPSHNILFNEIDSKHLKFNTDKKFDFVHIDGDHSYEGVINDLEKTWPLMNEQTILYMDDYNLSGVDLAIKNQIILKSNFTPFLYGDQSIFFHHKSQSKDDFVDYHIQQQSANFIYYINEEIYGTLALRARLPNVFVEHNQIWLNTLEAYNL